MASIWQRETVRRFRLHGLQPQRDAVSAVLAEIAAAQAAVDEKEVSYAMYAVGEGENPLIMDDGELGSKVCLVSLLPRVAILDHNGLGMMVGILMALFLIYMLLLVWVEVVVLLHLLLVLTCSDVTVVHHVG